MRVPWYLMAKGKGGGYKTASGPIVSVSDALAAPLRSLRVGIDPVQDLHGYDSPWPAGGEKNKLEVTSVSETQNGVTITVNSDGTISLSGTATDQVIFGVGSVALSGEYILSGCPSGGNYSTYFLYCVNYDYGSGATVTFDGTSKNVQLYVRSGVNTNGLVFKPMIRLSSVTDATFAPYSNICPISGWTEAKVWVKPTYDPTANPTATIQLGQTYYGGTLDMTDGVLTVDRAVVDLGTINWSADPNRSGVYYGGVADRKMSSGVGECSVYATNNISVSITRDSYISGYPSYGGNAMFFRDTRFVDYTRAQVQEALSGQTAIYELATPIEIPLTPTEISTLQGTNNLWADTGDVTVEYLSAGGADPDFMKLAVAFMGRK